MIATFNVPGWEIGRVQHLVGKHNLRWVGNPFDMFGAMQCKIEGTNYSYHDFKTELEGIRKHDVVHKKKKRWLSGFCQMLGLVKE